LNPYSTVFVESSGCFGSSGVALAALMAPIGMGGTASNSRARARSAREARAPFHAAPSIVVQLRAITTLSTSPIAKLRAADDERRQAKCNSLGDKLTVEAKALADLKLEKATVGGRESRRRADLGPVKYLATLIGASDQDVLRFFTLVVALLLDPAAVLSLLAARRRGAHDAEIGTAIAAPLDDALTVYRCATGLRSHRFHSKPDRDRPGRTARGS
jgi:hypothetical protein